MSNYPDPMLGLNLITSKKESMPQEHVAVVMAMLPSFHLTFQTLNEDESPRFFSCSLHAVNMFFLHCV